jgi:hypothetical protein
MSSSPVSSGQHWGRTAHVQRQSAYPIPHQKQGPQWHVFLSANSSPLKGEAPVVRQCTKKSVAVCTCGAYCQWHGKFTHAALASPNVQCTSWLTGTSEWHGSFFSLLYSRYCICILMSAYAIKNASRRRKPPEFALTSRYLGLHCTVGLRLRQSDRSSIVTTTKD